MGFSTVAVLTCFLLCIITTSLSQGVLSKETSLQKGEIQSDSTTQYFYFAVGYCGDHNGEIAILVEIFYEYQDYVYPRSGHYALPLKPFSDCYFYNGADSALPTAFDSSTQLLYIDVSSLQKSRKQESYYILKYDVSAQTFDLITYSNAASTYGFVSQMQVIDNSLVGIGFSTDGFSLIKASLTNSTWEFVGETLPYYSASYPTFYDAQSSILYYQAASSDQVSPCYLSPDNLIPCVIGQDISSGKLVSQSRPVFGAYAFAPSPLYNGEVAAFYSKGTSDCYYAIGTIDLAEGTVTDIECLPSSYLPYAGYRAALSDSSQVKDTMVGAALCFSGLYPRSQLSVFTMDGERTANMTLYKTLSNQLSANMISLFGSFWA